MSSLDFLFEGTAPPSTTTYGSTVTGIPSWLSDYTLGLVNKANAVGAEPYQAYGGPRVAGLTPDQQAAYAKTRSNVGAYQPALQGALQQSQGVMGSVQPQFDQANSMTTGAVAPGQGGLATAAPWLTSASNTFRGGNVDQYMNPYVNNVIAQGTLAANRNFNENIMPQLSDTFTSNGQFGSSRHEEAALRGARDLTEGLQTNAMGALSQAYNSGQNAFQSDMSRFGALASTAGQLGGQQQQAMLSAGQNLANQATQQGNLGVATAAQQGDLAKTGQQMGVTDAAQLSAIGAEQQQQTQRNLDTAYGDFQQERDYPKTQLDWMSQIIRGMPASTTSTQTSTGPANAYQPSPLSQLGSLATGLYGIKQATGSARGGLISSYARGGLSVIPGGLKTAMHEFEIAAPVSQLGGFDRAPNHPWSRAQLMQQLGGHLEEAGLDPALANRFRFLEKPKFLEFDSGRIGHAAAYYSAVVDGPVDLIHKIKTAFGNDDQIFEDPMKRSHGGLARTR